MSSGSTRGCTLDELARLVGFAPARIGSWLNEAEGELLPDGTVLDRAACAAIENELIGGLDEAHRQHPAAAGIARQRLRALLLESVPAAVFDGILGRLAARGRIVQDQGLVRRSGFRPARTISEPADALARCIERLFHAAGLAPPDAREVIGRDPRHARAVRDLVRRGRLVATFDWVQKREIVFHCDAVARARRTLEEQLGSPEGFLVGEAGRVLGISRKYSIPLLEYLDSVHCTWRVADRRVITRPRRSSAS